MALHDEIMRAILRGELPWRFKTRDLKNRPANRDGYFKVGNGEYAANSINVMPRNYSIRRDDTCKGDYVKKGREPAFYWFGDGNFELILDHSHNLTDGATDNIDFDFDEGESEALIKIESVSSSEGSDTSSSLHSRAADQAAEELNAAVYISEYLAITPFQGFYRRKKCGSPVLGWSDRLESYFWPTPSKDWLKTKALLSELSARMQSVIAALDKFPHDIDVARKLLDIFSEICVWGGVKLPESNPEKLAEEFLLCLDCLSRAQTPPKSCRLNSAWTKLYAFALPESFVIYDSRVANALTSILDNVFPIISSSSSWQPYGRLGTAPGRGGTRPRKLVGGWRIGYRDWDAQIAANKLCLDIMNQVNQQALEKNEYRKRGANGEWTLREIEAVLFMEGY